MIKFREARYSNFNISDLLSESVANAGAGATLGAAVGGLSSALLGGDKSRTLSWTTKGALWGAQLLVGYNLLDKLLNSSFLSSLTQKGIKNSNYNINTITRVLKMKGFAPDRDFTTNPKVADRLKTKVCIVIRSDVDLLSIIISSANDDIAKKALDEIMRGVPDRYKKTVDRTEKGNKVSLTAMSSNMGDVSYVANIAAQFMNRRIPVYLVEVNS